MKTVLTLTLVGLAACTEPVAARVDAAPPSQPSLPSPFASAPGGASSAVVTPTAPATPPEKIAAQHVLVAFKGAKDAPKTVKRSKADAGKRAAEAHAKALLAGSDFSALVAEYSDDPGKAERQGSVGVITPSKVVKPFADAAFALPVDGVSDVVETAYGFHVIKRNQ